jgi:hypothetical protein
MRKKMLKVIAVLSITVAFFMSCVQAKNDSGTTDKKNDLPELLVCVDATTSATIIAKDGYNYDFGTGIVKTDKKTTCRIINEGKGNLTVNDISLNSKPYFSLNNVQKTPFTLAYKEYVDFDIVFNPSLDGSYNSSLKIGSNDAVNPYTLNLTGKGVVSSPKIEIYKNSAEYADDSTYDFGSIVKDSGKLKSTFTIKNSGNADLKISSIVLSGPAYFSLASPTVPFTVSSGGSSTFDISFDPSTQGGPYDANIQISSNDSDHGTFKLNFTGKVISEAGPKIEVFAGRKEYSNNGSPYNFCPQILGVPVTTKFTIKNTGTTDLNISGTVLSDTVNFKLIANPPSKVGAGGEGTFSVRFNPSAAGTYSADITITNDDGSKNPFKLNIAGVSKSTVSNYRINLKFEHNTPPSGSGNVVYACWIEDEDGNFIQNIYVCNRLLGDMLTGTAIPRWKTTDYPLDIDTVSGASIDDNLDYTTDLNDTSRKFRVFFEVDHSWNGNDYFYDRPSFIYRSGSIDINNLVSPGYELDLIGWMSNDTEGSGVGQQPKTAIAGFEQYKLMELPAYSIYIADSSYMKKTLKVTVTKK